MSETFSPPAVIPAAIDSTAEVDAGQWSLAAIASLACGIVIIIPFLSGLAAVALGIIGLRQTQATFIYGRRSALAGTALGILNLVGWTTYFCTISSISAPGRAVANRFIADLNAGKIDYAAAECLENIHTDRLTQAADHLKDLGGVKSVAVLYVTTATANGATTGSVSGTFQTPSGGHSFQLRTTEINDVWKINEFGIQ